MTFDFVLIAQSDAGVKETSSFSFSVMTLIRNTPPYFTRTPRDVMISIDPIQPEANSWKLSGIQDDEHDNIQPIAVDLGEASSFLSFDPTLNKFEIQRDQLTDMRAGSYLIKLNLSDIRGASQTISFTIHVLGKVVQPVPDFEGILQVDGQLQSPCDSDYQEPSPYLACNLIAFQSS